MTIRNNTISDVGFWGGATAGLLVSGANAALARPGAFQNILIEGNTFENFDCHWPISSARQAGWTIGNNTFINLQQAAPSWRLTTLGGNGASGNLDFRQQIGP